MAEKATFVVGNILETRGVGSKDSYLPCLFAADFLAMGFFLSVDWIGVYVLLERQIPPQPEQACLQESCI